MGVIRMVQEIFEVRVEMSSCSGPLHLGSSRAIRYLSSIFDLVSLPIGGCAVIGIHHNNRPGTH